MRVFHHLYDDIISPECLFEAWDQFKKGKRVKADVGYFERHLEDNIFALHQELIYRTYRHSPYTGFYIKDPKVRHIHKACVRDRVVHHAVFQVLNPLFESTFISDSFSCRKGNGTHRGFGKLTRYARRVSQNYTRDCWALKCDVRKYYDSVDHDILLRLLGERIGDGDVMWLLGEIIGTFGKGRGIPIGNLTSQLFANIYLNRLDQFVKHALGVRFYLRYADDFVILHPNKGYLQDLICLLDEFLVRELRLTLHPDKIFLRKLSWGIDFVGYVALPHYSVVRTRTKRRAFRKMKRRIYEYHLGTLSEEQLSQTLQSYLGVFCHVSGYRIQQDLKNLWGYELNLY